jgi:hypothetical protein
MDEHKPATQALRTIAEMSGLRSGAIALRLAMAMPMEDGLEKPQRAYVAIILERALI